MPLWAKIMSGGFAAVMFASLGIGGISFYRQYEAGEEDFGLELAQDLATIAADMESQKRSTAGVALALAGDPEGADLIIENAREDIMRRYGRNLEAIRASSDIANVTYVNPTGVAVARLHNPTVFGDDISGRRQTVVQALKTGKIASGIEQGRDTLSVFTSAPVFRRDRIAGVVDVGTALTNDYFKRLRTAIKAEIAVHIARNGSFVLQNSTFEKGGLLTGDQLAAMLRGEPVTRLVTVGEQTFMVGGTPLVGPGGVKFGILEVASDVTPVIAARASALRSMALVTGLVFILVMAGFFFFARSIAGAIQRLTASMGRLAAGDYAAEVPSRERQDEIGAMARSVEVFKQAGLDKLRLEGEAGEARRTTEHERAANDASRASNAAEQAQVVEAVGLGLSALASGDLTHRIHDEFPPAYAGLKANFNEAVTRLEQTVSTIVTTARGIQSGTGEISKAADDLSRRTEQQAASLEETAAALDQVTATVRKTAEGADHARKAVQAASQDAQASGSVVEQAVKAMSEIERSSGQITQIISVIDEIAFQTNLLALNAGVEAARAGESGKGFAVVASEVRALAQRSADAAKEIKGLIQSSSRQVGEGVDLVGRAGEALSRISVQIAQINVIVSEIAASAREQSTGLGEVNSAVNQMDQVTQQNAAMVEQSTAASHAIADETKTLADLVANFRTGATARNVSPVPAASKRAGAAPRRAAPAPRSHGNLALKTEEDGWEEF